jgi:beta-keto acid cleavage enzyme
VRTYRGTICLVLLQATLNGPLAKADHGAVPVTLQELAADASQCVSAGARAFHIHPRDQSGAESLQARVVDRVVLAVREPNGMPVGVTTGEWIEPDLQQRLRLIREWTQPDYASVNLPEPGAVEVMQALLATRVGIEAGVCTVEDAELLVGCGLSGRVTRVMIEPVDVSKLDAVPLVGAIHDVLDQADERLRDFSTATARQPGSSSRTQYDVASTPASASKTPCCCPTASPPPVTPTSYVQLMSSEPAGPDSNTPAPAPLSRPAWRRTATGRTTGRPAAPPIQTLTTT